MQCRGCPNSFVVLIAAYLLLLNSLLLSATTSKTVADLAKLSKTERRQEIYRLGERPKRWLVRQFKDALQSTDLKTRQTAAEALAFFAIQKADMELLNSVYDHINLADSVSLMIESSPLGNSHPFYIEIRLSGPFELQSIAADKLAQGDASILDDLMQTAQKSDRHRAALIEPIVELGAKYANLDAIKLGLESGNFILVRKAITALGDSNLPEACRLLEPFLQNSTMLLKQAAVEALVELDSDCGIDIILENTETLSRTELLSALVYLNQFNVHVDGNSLSPLLDHENWQVRKQAVLLLGKQQNTVHLLDKAIDDMYVDVREAAFTGMQQQKQQALPYLHKTVYSHENLNRDLRVECIGRMQDAQSILHLLHLTGDDENLVADAAARALAGFKNIPAEILLEAARHENAQVRAKAVELLGRYQKSDEINTILEAFNDPVWYVRLAAIDAIQLLKYCQASPELAELLQDRYLNVRRKAAVALDVLQAEEFRAETATSREDNL